MKNNILIGFILLLLLMISMPAFAQLVKPAPQKTVSDTVELTSLKHWPQPIKQVPPVYPAIAQQDNVEAEIMLNVLIGKGGKPKNIKVVNVKTSYMSGAANVAVGMNPPAKYAKMFHKPSIDAVMKWRFTKPLRADSTAALVWVNVPLKYALQPPKK
jgi:hypothetical protein